MVSQHKQPTLPKLPSTPCGLSTQLVKFDSVADPMSVSIPASTKISTYLKIVSMVTDCKGVLCCTLNLRPLHCTCILKAAARLPGHTPQPGKQEAL